MKRAGLISLDAGGSSAALVTPDQVVTYGELRERVASRSAEFARLPNGLVVLLMRNDVASIVEYLGAVDAERPVALVDPSAPSSTIEMLVDRYRPAVISGLEVLLPGFREEAGVAVAAEDPARVHPDLAVLLATSGSTGSPKFVRLTASAVVANAASIAQSLRLRADDRAPANLPLHYSYGLSVLNSHLHVGASVVPTELSFMQREFWDLFDLVSCTSLAGVPYSYQILRRLKLDPSAHPSLRMLTQAGGRLADTIVAEFHDLAVAHGLEFFVMYGQTEAVARMAVLDHADVTAHLGSAGQAIPGGRFEIVEGEVVYYGPNVMMGYAEDAADLSRGDENRGRLATGDLGELDDDGFLRLTGRAKRIAKVFGTRVSLDDVEDIVSHFGSNACVAADDAVVVYIDSGTQVDPRALGSMLADRLRLPASGIKIRVVDELPRRANGKTDYSALEATHEAR